MTTQFTGISEKFQQLMRTPEEAQFKDLFGPPINTSESPKKVKSSSNSSSSKVRILKSITMKSHI